MKSVFQGPWSDIARRRHCCSARRPPRPLRRILRCRSACRRGPTGQQSLSSRRCVTSCSRRKASPPNSRSTRAAPKSLKASQPVPPISFLSTPFLVSVGRSKGIPGQDDRRPATATTPAGIMLVPAELQDHQGLKNSTARMSPSPPRAAAPIFWHCSRRPTARSSSHACSVGGGGLVPSLTSGNVDAVVVATASELQLC